MNASLLSLPIVLALSAVPAASQEIPALSGWQILIPTPGTHRGCVDMSAPHGGKGAGKIVGTSSEKNARACLAQEFFGKTAIKAGRTYHYSVGYRTGTPWEGSGLLLIDSYTKEGEKGRKELVSQKLGATAAWKTVAGQVAVPEGAVRVRMLLYLRGRGTVWYDDAFFGDAAGAPNLLKNGGFEPPASAAYDLAPEKKSGNVKFAADFENATLGKVKQLGPDEFYLYASPEGKPRSPFLWFHFRVEGCKDREVTFHINPAPFTKESTSGNGTRSPVMSYDGDRWAGIEDKSWNEDGTVLTFKHRFTQSPAWIASFFPFTAAHVTRFIESQKGCPYFKASVLGKTGEGRELRLYTITDPGVPEAGKRSVLFTALQHDLETTGAMALEGICRFLLTDDSRARRLRREFVFYVVPMMDPDGIGKGNLYCPVGNMNRQWGQGTTAETACVEKFVKALAARGRKIDLFMDFHGWCTPDRTTLFMTFGKEITDEASECDAVGLAETISRRLSGKVSIPVWRKRVQTVTGITSDLNRLAPGWMRFEAGARLAYSIEIFGEGECTQEGYLQWGRAFAEGIAEFTSDRAWQKLVVPTAADAAKQFETPPPEYSLTMWWFWNGDMTPENIRRDLAELKSRGIRSVMLWPYNGFVNLEYLSPAWFDRVRFAVEEAKRLDLRVWIMDEGCYPSGFVGGNVTRKRPGQRMQVLEARKNARGEIEVKPEYRTPATRYIHTPGFAKDGTYSLFDALDPAATRDFLADVHEQYKKCVGNEFGRTVLGFMGDEPSFPGVPYTAAIFDEFQRRKGYDVRPHLPKLFMKEATEEARRIRADYWDIWSSLYRDHYFKPQADWCEQEEMEFLMHLCGEEDMRTLVTLNGDCFRCMQPVQVPGVDAIWRQIWPDKTADYAKLASSAAHLAGRPRSFSEGYAVYGRGLSVEQAKWVLDHHLVRGINLFQAMSYLSCKEGFRPYFCPPDLNLSPQWPHFSRLFAYADRMSYLLSVGTPTASIALYYPTTSGWLGDFSADKAGLAVAQQLLEGQRDFDFVDDDSLHAVLKLQSGALVNRSGQRYRAVIVPPGKAISEKALGQLEQFAKAGGRVVFVGRLPELVVGRTFLHAAKGPSQLSWAVFEPKERLSAGVLARLPDPDCTVEAAHGGAACPSVKYTHRRLADAEVYFLFHEGKEPLETAATFEGSGSPQCWDAVTGATARIEGWSRRGKHVRIPLRLEPFETKTIVLVSGTARPDKVAATTYEKITEARRLDGDWSFTLEGKERSGPLKTWSDYGSPGYSGTVLYRKQFQCAANATKDLYLDLGDVKYSAKVRLNGRDLGVRAWQPFRWAVGDALQSGSNLLEVEVTNTAANELAGSPERLKEIEARGWLKNSYSRIYLKFDAEMVPSGLLGPVRLLHLRPALPADAKK